MKNNWFFNFILWTISLWFFFSFFFFSLIKFYVIVEIINCVVNIYSDYWMMNLLLVLCKYKDLSGSCLSKYYSLLCLLSISKSEYIKSLCLLGKKKYLEWKYRYFFKIYKMFQNLKKNYRLKKKRILIWKMFIYYNFKLLTKNYLIMSKSNFSLCTYKFILYQYY